MDIHKNEKDELRLWAKDDIVPSDLQEQITELEGKLKWHKEEKLRLEKEVHALREREYCKDCSAKTILPEPHGIGCRAKERIVEFESQIEKLIKSQKARIEAGS